jgi:acyl-CoA thioesterase-2
VTAPVFTSLLRLSPGSPTTPTGHSDVAMVGPPGPEPEGRLFGGQFLAQGLAAAYGTIDRDGDGGGPAVRVHSLHAQFLRPGDPGSSTRYVVEVVRDGRSFAVRNVSAGQDGRLLFQMMASFHRPEPGSEYQPIMPTVAGPERAPTTYNAYVSGARDRFDDGAGGGDEGWWGAARPVEIRYLDPPRRSEATDAPQRMWMRLSQSLTGEPQWVHDCALAYISDTTLIDHVYLPHGRRWHDRANLGASLDHAMWFHRPAVADQWLLFDQVVESTGRGRGLTTGRLYQADGTLVATCAQEGLMRWSGDAGD